MSEEFPLARRVRQLSGSVAREILSRTESSNIVSFAGGLPDRAIWEGVDRLEVKADSFQYGPSEGDARLRGVFAQRMRRDGVDAKVEGTLILSGSQQGLDLVAKLMLEPGRTVVVEAPAYLAALQVFRLFEAKIVAIPMDRDGIDIVALREAVEREKPAFVYLNPSFQNPTGICYSESRRRAVAALLEEARCLLVEDDPYRDLKYGEATVRPIVSWLEECDWVYLSSVSKTLMPGLRIGFLASSLRLFLPLTRLKQAADLHTSRLSESVALQLLSNERGYEGLVERTRERYRRKRDLMDQALGQWMGEEADWALPEGGMFFWLRLRRTRELGSLMEACLSRGIAIMPGDPFFEGRRGLGQFLRLNFTNPPLSEIDRGIEVLATVLRGN